MKQPGVGRITRVSAVRFTAFVPAFLLTPSALPSLSVTVMPVRVSLKRIRYTFAAPAHATANHGMHYAIMKRGKNHLAQQTTAAHLRHQLVAGESHTHRHDGGGAVRLQDVHVVGLRGGVAVAVVEDGVVRLVDPLPQNHVEGLAVRRNGRMNGGRRQQHADLNGDVGGHEAGHSADRVDDLLGLGVLHRLDDVAGLPQLLVAVLVLASLPGFDLGHGLVVRLLTENDLSGREEGRGAST